MRIRAPASRPGSMVSASQPAAPEVGITIATKHRFRLCHSRFIKTFSRISHVSRFYLRFTCPSFSSFPSVQNPFLSVLSVVKKFFAPLPLCVFALKICAQCAILPLETLICLDFFKFIGLLVVKRHRSGVSPKRRQIFYALHATKFFHVFICVNYCLFLLIAVSASRQITSAWIRQVRFHCRFPIFRLSAGFTPPADPAPSFSLPVFAFLTSSPLIITHPFNLSCARGI